MRSIAAMNWFPSAIATRIPWGLLLAICLFAAGLIGKVYIADEVTDMKKAAPKLYGQLETVQRENQRLAIERDYLRSHERLNREGERLGLGEAVDVRYIEVAP